MQRKYAFWLHYNKPAAASRGRPMWSIHYRGKCHIVEDIKLGTPVYTRTRNSQPRGVLAGKAESFEIKDNTAYIS